MIMIIKKNISSLLSKLGILSLIEHYSMSNKAFVLMYHRVLSAVDSQPSFVQDGMYVTATSFEKQITFLRKRYKVVFFDDLIEMVRSGEDIGGHCAITFDDGWRDNYTEAFQLLKKYSIPATIYLATGFIDTGRIFWPDELAYFLDKIMTDRSVIKGNQLLLNTFLDEINMYQQVKRKTIIENGIEKIKGYPVDKREEILGCLRKMIKLNSFPRQLLNWEEVQEMSVSGLVRFDAHTVNHQILDQITLQNVREELFLSRESIERHLGTKVRTFAYPNGNHTNSVRKILEELGFNAAVTTRKGFMSSSVPVLEVPRIAIHEDVSSTVPMFRTRIIFSRF